MASYADQTFVDYAGDPSTFTAGTLSLRQAIGSASSLWQKSREPMRRGIAPGPRRRDEAVLAEIQASLDNVGPGARTQAAAARLLPQAARGAEDAEN